MPSVKKLTLKDWKGRNATTGFDRLNLLVGPNGSGKSSRIQALRFAMQGDSPMGKRPEAAAAYAGPLGCSVEVELSDGFTWTRGLQKDVQTGSISQFINIAGQNMGVKAAEAKLADRVGQFAPMFDLGAFRGLSPEARRNFVLDLCAKASPEAADPDRMVDDIWLAVLESQLGPGTVATAKEAMGEGISLLTTLSAKLSEAWSNELCKILEVVRKDIQGDMTVSIGNALQTVKLIENASKQGHDGARQAAVRLSEQKAQLVVSSGTLAELREQEAKLRADRDEILAQINNQSGRQAARKSFLDAIERHEREMKRAEDAVANLKGQEQKYQDMMAEVVTLEQAAADIDTQIAAWTGPTNSLLVGLKETLDACRKDRDELVAAVEKDKAAIARIDGHIHATESNISIMKSNEWLQAFALWQVIKAKCGPVDAQIEVPFRLLDELITKNSDTSRLAEFEAQLEKLKAERKEVDENLSKLIETTAEAVAEYEKAQADFDERNVEALNASKVIDEKRQEATRTRDQARMLKAQCEHRQQCIAQETERAAQCSERKLATERELNALDAQGGYVGDEALASQKQTLDAAIADIEAQIDGHRRAQVLEEELTRTIARAEQEMVRHEVAKAVGHAIRGIREQLMERLISPLMTSIRQFLSVVNGFAPYCRLVNDRGTAIFDLGWFNGKRDVSMDAMSGGEAVLFGAALAYALVRMANPPVKLLLLEVAEVDMVNTATLLKALEAVDGIDNVILASSNVLLNDFVASDEWNLISLNCLV